MYDVLPRSSETVLGIRLWGTCVESDIERFRRWLGDYAPRFGPLSLMVVANHDRCGDRLTALWRRLAHDIDVTNDLQRIALVGTVGPPTWYGHAARRLTKADVRCFGTDEVDEAWSWLSQDAPATTLLPCC